MRQQRDPHWPWLFIFEALAVFAFGISWFVKGRTLQHAVRRATAAVRIRPAARRAELSP